ncbi:MAG: peptidylprolyl isomerase [Kiritimatiellia bacterium]
MKRIAWILFWALSASVRGQTDGIFADFSTSMGDFTVWLDHERAPRAVASFVGLATGEGGWADPQSNVFHRPFYDGSIFHRVAKVVESNEVSVWTNGIAIQGGAYLWRSVNTNTGVVTTNISGPGYQMLECVTNGLTHSNGVISMANSGPNTDGSQFFITATNWPNWDGSYSVFGHVTEGMNVVTSIAAVAVQGTGDRPVDDIVLSNVVIRRVGAAAEAFDVAAQGVPSPESAPTRISVVKTISTTNVALAVELAAQTKPMMFSDATNIRLFSEWDHQVMFTNLTFYTNDSLVLTQSWDIAMLGDRHFFHSSRIRYPVPITAPINHRGRIYTFSWNTVPAVTNESHFGPDAATSGVSYEWVGTNAVVTNQLLSGWESWTQNAYSAYLVSLDSRIYYYYYSLGFNPGAGTNRFSCRRVHGISGDTFVFSGTFTVQ